MLIVDHLNYQYGANQVLADVSVQMDRGQLGMLVGYNGAGKSTLLRCMAGWTLPDQGTVTINGVSLQDQEQEFRKQVTLVPDTPDFYDELTAWEHLQFIAQLHRVPNWTPRAESLLEAFQLADHQRALPFTFSRGMRYKLGLCLALLVHPPLLLLDEPFGPLDALSSQGLWRLLGEYVQEGGSVLFSSHTLPSNQIPSLVFHLRRGHIEQLEPSDTLDLLALLDSADEEDDVDYDVDDAADDDADDSDAP